MPHLPHLAHNVEHCGHNVYLGGLPLCTSGELPWYLYTKFRSPGHAFNETGTEVVERDGHFHLLVGPVGVTMAQQHDLVMVAEVVVGYGDGGRGADDINEAVGARGKGVVFPEKSSYDMHRFNHFVKFEPLEECFFIDFIIL